MLPRQSFESCLEYFSYVFLLQCVNYLQFLGATAESRDLDAGLSSTFGLRAGADFSNLRELFGTKLCRHELKF
jgi:hypothetical protein